MRFLIILLILSFSSPVFSNGNSTIQSFSKAKKLLARQVYYDHQITFYCGCDFINKKITKHNGYEPKKPGKRSKRIEWEHVVPAHAFGKSFPEWHRGDPDCRTRKNKPFKGRNCARKAVELFRLMESDLYNLVPAVGEINGLRSNYSFTMIPGEKRIFGDCDMEIENKKAEPPPHQRGNIARTYLYMNDSYPGRGIISKKNRKLFEAWNKADPIDSWECERCKRIEEIQGNENQYVKKACVKKKLW